MVRVSSPAKLRPWSELTAKMVMGVVPGLITNLSFTINCVQTRRIAKGEAQKNPFSGDFLGGGGFDNFSGASVL